MGELAAVSGKGEEARLMTAVQAGFVFHRMPEAVFWTCEPEGVFFGFLWGKVETKVEGRRFYE